MFESYVVREAGTTRGQTPADDGADHQRHPGLVLHWESWCGECSSTAEHRTVAPVVGGSIPLTHPNFLLHLF
jgi:hypothetical protein